MVTPNYVLSRLYYSRLCLNEEKNPTDIVFKYKLEHRKRDLTDVGHVSYTSSKVVAFNTKYP